MLCLYIPMPYTFHFTFECELNTMPTVNGDWIYILEDGWMKNGECVFIYYGQNEKIRVASCALQIFCFFVFLFSFFFFFLWNSSGWCYYNIGGLNWKISHIVKQAHNILNRRWIRLWIWLLRIYWCKLFTNIENNVTLFPAFIVRLNTLACQFQWWCFVTWLNAMVYQKWIVSI